MGACLDKNYCRDILNKEKTQKKNTVNLSYPNLLTSSYFLLSSLERTRYTDIKSAFVASKINKKYIAIVVALIIFLISLVCLLFLLRKKKTSLPKLTHGDTKKLLRPPECKLSTNIGVSTAKEG